MLLEAAASALAMSMGAAEDYWNVPFGDPPVFMHHSQLIQERIDMYGDGNPKVRAHADLYTGEIRIAYDQYNSELDLCDGVNHELGHRIRGMNPFTDNPSDPYHSSVPYSAMAATGRRLTTQCMMAFPPTFVKRQYKIARKNRWYCSPKPEYPAWACTKANRETKYIYVYP